LHDVDFKNAHTYREFIESSMPDYVTLPATHQNRLMEEVARMRKHGEFGPEQFRPDPATMDTASQPSQPTPSTVEQQLTLEALRQRLRDPAFTRTRTLGDLAALPEVATLTLEQRQQLANEALRLLSRGEMPLRHEDPSTHP
jgi:hypothetical protein